MVMQAAQDRDRSNATDGLNRPAHGRILVQRQMRENVIVVRGIGSQDPLQVCLAEHNDVVEALPSD